MAASGETRPEAATVRNEFALERYRYILQQIHAVNENAHRFLAVYQTLATTLVGAALALFVGYRKWDVASDTARSGVIGLLVLTTVVAAFTITLIVVGALASLFPLQHRACSVRSMSRHGPHSGQKSSWPQAQMSLPGPGHRRSITTCQGGTCNSPTTGSSSS
ncbi:DUF2157 domain-containing protein [Streptomyces spinoverrucosus]|uniref:DUF2157 domain-containing protein n=1 Tax=Streptomyces spinoverrucosus TaxID=284043 RepID=UPI001E5F8C15|nr:DUF2157 domain-containing protein [Streptomyces spinoverrucosus]